LNLWKDENINIALRMKLMKVKVWAVYLYGAEGWRIDKSLRNRTEAF